MQAGGERRLSPSAPYNRGDASASTSRSAAPASSARAWRCRSRASASRSRCAARRGRGGRATTSAPTRSTPASVDLLRRLKVWDALAADAKTPVHDMVVRGDARGAALEFSAWEQRVGELAVITDAAALERELDAALRFAPHVTRVEADVAADARRPLRRPRRGAALHALGAGFERSDYGQQAIAARLVATLPHRHVARQWFRSPDVLALLPFDRPERERSYALVWSLPTERADALLAIDAGGVRGASSRAAGGRRGRRAAPRPPSAPPGRSSSAAPPPGAGPGWVLARRRRARRPSARRPGPQPRPRRRRRARRR